MWYNPIKSKEIKLSRECPILVSTFHKFTKLVALCKKKLGIQHFVVYTLQPLLSRTCTANICQDTDLQSPSGLCMVDIFNFLNTRNHSGGRLFVQKMGGASDIWAEQFSKATREWVKSPSLLRPLERSFIYLCCTFQRGLERSSSTCAVRSSAGYARDSGSISWHRYTYEPHPCRTSQYRRAFILLSVTLWNDLGDPLFDGVGLSGFKNRANAFSLS